MFSPILYSFITEAPGFQSPYQNPQYNLRKGPDCDCNHKDGGRNSTNETLQIPISFVSWVSAFQQGEYQFCGALESPWEINALGLFKGPPGASKSSLFGSLYHIAVILPLQARHFAQVPMTANRFAVVRLAAHLRTFLTKLKGLLY